MTNVPRYILPGRWGRIDLRSDQSAKKSVQRLVEDATGKDDALSMVRADLRRRFDDVVVEARAGGAVELQLAREISPGLPLSASLAVMLPDVDVSELDRLGLAELAGLLGSVVPPPAADDPLQHEVQHDSVRAVRQIQHRAPVLGQERVPIVQVDYWVAAAKPARLALFSFTTPLIAFETEMIELFDAVIATIRWPVPAAV